MSSRKHQEGAINVLFFIFALVIGLVGWTLWFMKLQDADEADTRRRTAVAEAVDWQEQFQFARDAYQVVSPITGGGFPTDCPVPDLADLRDGRTAEEALKSYTDQARRDLGNLKDEIAKPGINPTSFKAAWDDMKNKINELNTEIQNQKLEIGNLKTQVQEKDNQIAQVNTSKESDRTKTTETFEAEVDNYKNQLTDLRGQNDTYAEKNRTLTDEKAQSEEKSNKQVQDALQAKEELEAQVSVIKQGLKLARENERSDGNVVMADPVSGTVWIDVGASKMLLAGTRFKVYETGKRGLKIHKGYIRVTRVHTDKAECRVDEAGVGQVGKGDWLYNPYFEPGKAQHFYFLGQLPGAYNRQTVEAMLKKRGAVIDDKVTVLTNFIVMGVQEDEEAEPLTDDPNFRLAQRYQVQLLKAADLEPYLKF